ncbi:CpsD/CapB family tyrosine-protein kinase [Lacticaseibacillus baoqingensis]|uniref:CpsD/CapB family tyrosine-protein kinase n=1 Tax=Lacticaseibacillus baoqingensis TaxID=2486013 RepID=A0ABW4E3N0_9LACO|nr:CpsD/CapB family tyrosine-protein kinase [Lacticaseibacillus baoqingensis]
MANTTNDLLAVAPASQNQFRALRNELFLKRQQSPIKTILVTSPIDGQGKSTVSANLAQTFAQNGDRTLLIDANYRHSDVSAALGDKTQGLAELLAANAAPEQYIQPTAIANLSLLAAGAVPEDPSALFVNPAFAQLLESLQQVFAVVIIDGDTFLQHADMQVLATLCDFTLLVVGHKQVKKTAFADTLQALKTDEVTRYGVVYNQAPSKRSDYDY